MLPEGADGPPAACCSLNRPAGHEMRLYAMKGIRGQWEVGTDLSPDPWPDNMTGAGAHRWLDHLLLMCDQLETGVNRR